MGLESHTAVNNNLICESNALVVKPITITATACTRGQVLGKITKSCPTSGTAAGTNQGNGTCTSVTAGLSTKLGVYTILCTVKATAATFTIKAPDGSMLENATAGSAYTNPQLNFTIAQGDTVFEVGDKFTVTVVAGAGTYKAATATAVDGSQDVETMVICGEDIPASGVGIGYFGGVFNVKEVSIDNSFTLANLYDQFAKRGIHFKSSITN